MRDFIGQELKVGDFVAGGGSGNRRAEYGMILYKIYETSAPLKVERLTVKYNWHDENGERLKEAEILPNKRKTTINNVKIVRINPPLAVIKAFNNPTAYPELVSKWLHGQEIEW